MRWIQELSMEDRVKALAVCVLVVAGVGFLFVLTGHNAGIFNFDSSNIVQGHNITVSNENNLETILQKASMENNTIILATVNEAWATPGSILDLFLESLREGEHTNWLLKHLVIVALDEKAYQRCNMIHGSCYRLKTDGVDFSAEKRYMTEDFVKIMWRRIKFFRRVIELGYSFVFTDVDVMWLRDPMTLFKEDSDYQGSCDYFNGEVPLLSEINTGLYYVKSNNRTRLLFEHWYESRETYPGRNDQNVLNLIKSDKYLQDIGLSFEIIPTVYFGGLCQPSNDFGRVSTMHTNCCCGLKEKLNDLRVILDSWKMYRALPPRLKITHQNTWRAPQKCRC